MALQLDDVFALAVKLVPKERLQLIERVAASVERDIVASPPVAEQPTAHWGQNLLRLLDEVGPLELAHPEIEDPVEWGQKDAPGTIGRKGLCIQ